MRGNRLASIMLALSLLILPVSAAQTEEDPVYPDGPLLAAVREYAPFPDAVGTWCAEAVRTVYETGLVDGRADGTYGPFDTLTCPHILAITARFHHRLTGGDGQIPDTPEGTAVPEELRGLWCEKYYVYLASALGYSGPEALAAFSPRENCSRRDFVELLSAVLERTGQYLPGLNTAGPNLPDLYLSSVTGKLPGLSRPLGDAILYFYAAGILTGVDRYGTFGGGDLTRGQAAAMLARILDPAQRVRFVPEPFDFCRDVLGLEPELTVMVVNGYEITANQFSYAAAVRPSSKEEAMAFAIRETSAFQLAFQADYEAPEEDLAELYREAASMSGYGGLNGSAWFFALQRNAAITWAYDTYCTYAQEDGEASFFADLQAISDHAEVWISPALETLDWGAVLLRRQQSPYARMSLQRSYLVGTIGA